MEKKRNRTKEEQEIINSFIYEFELKQSHNLPILRFLHRTLNKGSKVKDDEWAFCQAHLVIPAFKRALKDKEFAELLSDELSQITSQEIDEESYVQFANFLIKKNTPKKIKN